MLEYTFLSRLLLVPTVLARVKDGDVLELFSKAGGDGQVGTALLQPVASLLHSRYGLLCGISYYGIILCSLWIKRIVQQ